MTQDHKYNSEDEELPIQEKETLFSRSPFLVIGATGVVGTLVYGMWKFIGGGSDAASASNKGMRMRVGGQAAIVALLGASVIYQWADKKFIHPKPITQQVSSKVE